MSTVYIIELDRKTFQLLEQSDMPHKVLTMREENEEFNDPQLEDMNTAKKHLNKSIRNRENELRIDKPLQDEVHQADK